MPSKQQDASKPTVSPVLFMSVDGGPMSFYLRPGPVKRDLQPLITAGGGKLCKVQEPGAILLIDPEEKNSIPETTAHWYVSTKYIQDCVDKDEQLDLEDYRLNPEVPRQSARLNHKKINFTKLTGVGRVAYTPEEDSAILSYISKHRSDIGGNRIWQEMQKRKVTCHSWQSMKYRYRVRLAKILSDVVEDTATEEESEKDIKVEENQDSDVENPDDADPPQTHSAAEPVHTHSAESEQRQITDQSTPAEVKQTEIIKGETSTSPQVDDQHTSPQKDQQPEESTEDETTDDKSSQLEEPNVESEAGAQPIPVDSTDSDETQTMFFSQKESIPDDSPLAHTLPSPDPSPQKEPKEKQAVDEQPRRTSRRQLVLDDIFVPESKKLRSASETPEQPSPSPSPSSSSSRQSVKTRSPRKTLQRDAAEDPPPAKTARGEEQSERRQEEDGQTTVSETPQAAAVSTPTPKEGGKRKEKRKLGILEMATREFEDGSGSDEIEIPDSPNPRETATKQPTTTEAPLPTTSDTAAGPAPQQSSSDRRPGPQETDPPQPAPTEPCKAHLFIFDSESQQEESQSLIGGSSAAPAANKDPALSLTQVQLEEDKQRIRELMKQTKQDLVTVTKALIRMSGDFAAAVEFLLNPHFIPTPLWDRGDDDLLFSGDPVARQQLQEKYGEEDVARRIIFLEVDG